MNRRPWPIVILAVIQILSPIFGLLGASFFYGTSVSALAVENWQFSSHWQKVETFLLPVVVGLLIYATRRIGYYLALLGCGYIIYRNMMEFVITDREAPVWITIVANLFVFGMIVYLCLPKVRAIYLNPSLRWWEASPRFMISWPAKILRAGDAPTEAQFHDISIGGAAVNTSIGAWLEEEQITISFDQDAVPMKLKGNVVYRKEVSPGQHRIGIEWSESNTNPDRSKLRRLIRTLDTGGVPISRRLPYWWDDFKDWLSVAYSSADAWIPSSDKKRIRRKPDQKE